MITGNLDHLDRMAGQLTGPVKKPWNCWRNGT